MDPGTQVDGVRGAGGCWEEEEVELLWGADSPGDPGSWSSWACRGGGREKWAQQERAGQGLQHGDAGPGAGRRKGTPSQAQQDQSPAAPRVVVGAGLPGTGAAEPDGGVRFPLPWETAPQDP